MVTSSYAGCWPALVTPFTAENTVNTKMLQELTEYLIAKGIGGLYLCGSTGEGLYQSVEERKLVTSTVMAQVNGRVPAIVHVGCIATRHAVELARHAQQVGATGVSSVLPTLNSSLAGTYTHYSAIAGAVPSLPFFPYLFGAQTDATSLMRELADRIPNFGGAKYTGPNMVALKQIIDLGGGRWAIFSGMDEQCVFAAMFGCAQNIGSTLNFMPGVYCEIRRLLSVGDLAQAVALQSRANQVTAVAISFGFMGALREMMRMLGLDCGDPRLPTPPLPKEKRAALREQLEAAGFSALASM